MKGMNTDMSAPPPPAAFGAEAPERLPAIRVVVAEPHEIYRRALTRLFEEDPRIELIGVTGHIAEVESITPDGTTVLMALRNVEDCQVIDRIRKSRPSCRVVVLASDTTPETVCDALRSGARGFLSECAEPEHIIDGVLRVAAGETLIDQTAITHALLWAIGNRAREGMLDCLTARERQTLALLAEGHRPSAIAERLFLSVRTVESHLAGVYRKLRVSGRIEAVQTYRRLTGV